MNQKHNSLFSTLTNKVYTIFSILLLFNPNTVLAESKLYQGPVFDMHLHAARATQNGPPGQSMCIPVLSYFPTPDPQIPWPKQFMDHTMKPQCENPIVGPMTDDEVLQQTLQQLKRQNAVGVLGGAPEDVLKWVKSNPDRFIPSIQLNLDRDPYGPEEVRKWIQEDGFKVLGEISNQYIGVAPNDERMDGFYAVAAENDIPIAIHMGGGPPGSFSFFPNYRVSAGDPALLEPILHKYPNLRISIMHMAEGYSDKVKMMLYTYPNIYLDIGGLSWMRTDQSFKKIMLDFIEAGWGGRLMFGSDQMNWPGLITPAIQVIREADYLTLEQKEAILWSNAIRFMKLDDKEMRARAMK